MENETNETPAAAEPPAQQAAEPVSREAYEKALADSQRREEATRKAQARAAQLEARLAELEGQKAPEAPAEPSPTADAPAWAQAMMNEINELKKGNAARTRDGARAQLLSGVPDGNRDAAGLLLQGIEAREGLDLTNPADAEVAAAKLRTYSQVFVDQSRGQQRQAAQVGPDGKLTIPDGMTLDDVPPELADTIFNDPEAFGKISGNTAGVIGSSAKYVI